MNLTIRNIPEEVMEKIRTLSKIAKRSINNEVLILLESSVQEKINNLKKQEMHISKETQISIWGKLAEKWDDDRSTAEIIEDIYSSRTLGREFEL
jgi:hypothetical protein